MILAIREGTALWVGGLYLCPLYKTLQFGLLGGHLSIIVLFNSFHSTFSFTFIALPVRSTPMMAALTCCFSFSKRPSGGFFYFQDDRTRGVSPGIEPGYIVFPSQK
jgi:hypothetical protein